MASSRIDHSFLGSRFIPFSSATTNNDARLAWKYIEIWLILLVNFCLGFHHIIDAPNVVRIKLHIEGCILIVYQTRVRYMNEFFCRVYKILLQVCIKILSLEVHSSDPTRFYVLSFQILHYPMSFKCLPLRLLPK